MHFQYSVLFCTIFTVYCTFRHTLELLEKIVIFRQYNYWDCSYRYVQYRHGSESKRHRYLPCTPYICGTVPTVRYVHLRYGAYRSLRKFAVCVQEFFARVRRRKEGVGEQILHTVLQPVLFILPHGKIL